MIAAGRVAEDNMSEAVRDASAMRPRQHPLTQKQQQAWQRLNKALGDDVYTIEIASARDIAEAGLKAMQAEAEQLLTNPAVKLAYEQFLLVCELTKQSVDNA
jgi:DNA-directed RNA polymerase specialized sigma subunit